MTSYRIRGLPIGRDLLTAAIIVEADAGLDAELARISPETRKTKPLLKLSSGPSDFP